MDEHSTASSRRRRPTLMAAGGVAARALFTDTPAFTASGRRHSKRDTWDKYRRGVVLLAGSRRQSTCATVQHTNIHSQWPTARLASLRTNGRPQTNSDR